MSLEIEKYLNEQQRAKQLSEYDLLYQTVKDDEEAQTVVDDNVLEEDTPVIEDPPVSQGEDYEVSTEDFSIRPGLELIRDTMASLMQIGIHYTPILLGKLYKGTLYGITRLTNTLILGMQSISDYHTRHVNNFQSLRNDIASLNKALDLMESKAVDNQLYTKVKIINNLKMGESVDFSRNIDQLSASLTSLINDLSKSIDSDIGYIKQLIALVTSRSIKEPHIALQNIPIKSYLTEGSIEGYTETSEVVTNYYYDELLPGDVRVLAALPSLESDNIDLLTRAYNQSSLYLGLDRTAFQAIDSIPYQTKDEIKALLTALDAVCIQAMEHVRFYEHIHQSQKSLKYLFRLYISTVASSQQKMNAKMSLIDYINLKTLFIHRLYIPFSIDFHTYTARIVRSGLTYCEDHIKQFS